MLENKIAILAQKMPAPIARTALGRVLVLLVLPFLGVVAAFGIAPDTATDTLVRQHIV